MPREADGEADGGDAAEETEASHGSRVSWDDLRRASVRAFAKLPRPARLLWMILIVLGVYAIVFTLQGQGIVPLIALPAFAVETDILFQMFRYHRIRAPDAALATGLLLALLLPPSVPLIQAIGVASAAIALRHVLRVQERPLFNPAAAGVLLGALFFGLAPSWWGSIGVWLVVALGIVVTLRTPGSWRIPAVFLASYGVITILGTLLVGDVSTPMVLLLGLLDPSILFFGFFMVPEPRSSVTRAGDRWVFGIAVGVATALLPALLPSLAPLVALLLGNGLAAVLRRRTAVEAPVETKKRQPTRRSQRRHRARDRREAVRDVRAEWKTPQRVAAGVLVVVVLGGMAFALNPPRVTPYFSAVRPGAPVAAGVVATTSNCTVDNPSIASNIATFLHQRLGPSVLLSVDTGTGTVVFYDPVNKVTVTETNIYEDYGFAEFNGDDYAALGCAA